MQRLQAYKYAGLYKLRAEWRNGPETPRLKDAPVHPLQQALKDLELAQCRA